MDAAPAIPPPDASTPEPSSLTDRLANVIIAPGEVFEEVRRAPVRASNWLVPLLVVCAISIVFIFVAFSQPPVLRAMDEQRAGAFQKKVAAGKMTQAQADQIAAATEKFVTPTFLKIAGSGGAVLSSTALLFLIALVFKLALKWFADSSVSYMKTVETCGLAMVILVPQIIIRIWLVLWKQNLLVTVGPTLFLANPNPANKVHLFLAIFDIVDIWWLSILSFGLSKVANVRFRTAAFLVFALWYGFRIIAVLLTPA
ncbi:MAG TPA: YIP1 family protein [Verrucomicrobiae bacterium]|jgi:hypothetical protein|nr:YIP1 family protein [Verrucomicrobiae bacterium]